MKRKSFLSIILLMILTYKYSSAFSDIKITIPSICYVEKERITLGDIAKIDSKDQAIVSELKNTFIGKITKLQKTYEFSLSKIKECLSKKGFDQ